MKVSLAKVMVMFALAVATLPVFVIAILIWRMNLDIRSIVASEFDKIGLRATRQIVDDTLKICRIIHKTQSEEEQKARASMNMRFSQLGAPRLLSQKTKFNVSSQMTPTEFIAIDLPVLAFGSTPIKLKKSDNGTIATAEGTIKNILTELKTDTGLEFSILQKIDDAGNMLRIASTTSDAEIGTYIPATGGYDDGAIVRTLMARKTFTGVSRTGSEVFVVNYEPILDPYGDVIGAFAYGRSQASVLNLMKYFETIRIGATGYVWAIELAGRGESIVRASRDGKRNGFIVEGDTFKERKEMTLEMISSAVGAIDKVSVREYKLGTERDVSDIITAYTYFKPWNLVIGASVARSDFDVGVEKIISTVSRFMVLLVSIGVLILFFAGFGSWITARSGANMATDLKLAIDKIKNGDIANAKDDLTLLLNPKKWSNSEIFRLADALNSMTENFSSLLAKVKISGENFAQSASKISEGTSNIDAISSERADVLAGVSSTIDSISTSVLLLNMDAREASKNIDASLAVLSDGGNLLSRLSENTLPLLSAADSVSARLAVIKDKTERIATAVSTINAVGDRTNMLSLNAKIESERATEFGGFEAVSAEISKLADQTAVSVMEVSKMVADMTDSVESGVGEMNSFSQRMKLNSEMIEKLHFNLSSAENQIAELGPKFESLATSIASQEENVSNIGELVESLEAFASGAREKVELLKETTSSISKTSELLIEKVSRFNLSK
ncbi:MAG: Cache 3/Cache 2 fusion domain-containing protein [Opitutales bacterium]|nr:Cache 3/Cache 2 fusion domain-containing protein [Opitutales bacterium]